MIIQLTISDKIVAYLNKIRGDPPFVKSKLDDLDKMLIEHGLVKNQYFKAGKKVSDRFNLLTVTGLGEIATRYVYWDKTLS